MAQPVTLTSWSAEHVRVADVLDALESLRKPKALPPTRTSVLTLVVVAPTRQACEAAMTALHELGGRHPARVLALLVQVPGASEGESTVDAEVRLLGGEAEGQALWFEEIELGVRGPAAAHLDSLIEPFTLPDLPVVVWFLDHVPSVDNPLLRTADAAIVDARRVGGADALVPVHRLSKRLPVVDLSWHRLRPWREVLAGLFESPHTKPFLRGVRSAWVVGHDGPRHLLGGWIADRLQLSLDAVVIERAEHVSMRIEAVDESGRTGTFEVIRTSEERIVRAHANLSEGPSPETIVPLPPRSPAWGLADALAHIEHDRIYERALRGAIALASRQ
jgi:glucose-6-phosphate dehydrogenase assembly protein OpcA